MWGGVGRGGVRQWEAMDCSVKMKAKVLYKFFTQITCLFAHFQGVVAYTTYDEQKFFCLHTTPLEIHMTHTPKFTTRAAALVALNTAEDFRDLLADNGYDSDDAEESAEAIEAAEADVKAALEDLENAEIYETKHDAA
jgi:hypothetical protein